ncbi:hypothetical protein JMA_06330 [Jeotgalibacillus malaysiensis]|uniref:DUF1648 domain-containing protein n=1 Tax=Jeotgalibacillus malaysiensis TaxID=1508404 RepID=A0A0B5AHT6_9BACL|nr:DUF1648 domain-containing protein [Jeotgalibacillus malaysiensis]AJD89950.1 hypothetical protein JMA_06330 [Jeotgalibacillus malaysiensis]
MFHSDRPLIKVDQPIWAKAFSMISLILLIIASIYLAMSWGDLSDVIPIHFNAAGEADGFGGKWSAVMLPVIGFFMWGGLTALERVPHTYNYLGKITEENAEKQYKNGMQMMNVIKNLCVILFAYITYELTLIGTGGDANLTAGVMPIFMTLLFGSMGWFIYRSIKLSSFRR